MSASGTADLDLQRIWTPADLDPTVLFSFGVQTEPQWSKSAKTPAHRQRNPRKCLRGRGGGWEENSNHEWGVIIHILVASCFGNQDKLWKCSYLGMCADVQVSSWFGKKKTSIEWFLPLLKCPVALETQTNGSVHWEPSDVEEHDRSWSTRREKRIEIKEENERGLGSSHVVI